MGALFSKRSESDDDENTAEDPNKVNKGNDNKCCVCPGSTNDQPDPAVWPVGGEDGQGSTSGGASSHWDSPTKQLFCRSGFSLVIAKNGKVRGTRKPFHKYAVLEFSSVAPGEVRIKGKNSGYYLAMNHKSKLYGELDPTEEGTVFVESYQDGWNTYLSRKYAHFGWYVSINKVGKAKAGHKTDVRQKAVSFLPRAPAPD